VFKLSHKFGLKLTPDQLRLWCLNRVYIHGRVLEVEKLISSSVLIWYSLYFIATCVEVMVILEEEDDVWRPSWAKMINVGLDLIYLNLYMVCLSICASYVGQTSAQSASCVHHYLSTQQSGPKSCSYQHLSHLLCLSQSHPVITFTAGLGVFQVDKGLIVSVWMSIATYLLVIISWRKI